MQVSVQLAWVEVLASAEGCVSPGGPPEPEAGKPLLAATRHTKTSPNPEGADATVQAHGRGSGSPGQRTQLGGTSKPQAPSHMSPSARAQGPVARAKGLARSYASAARKPPTAWTRKCPECGGPA